MAKQVSDDTFEKKFLSFDTFPSDLHHQPSLLHKPLFTENVFADQQSTQNFLNNFQHQNETWPALVLGDFNNKQRISSVITNRGQLHLAHGISLLLRGSPFILYGDELELKTSDSDSSYMKWNSQENCGFSTNLTLTATITADCQNSVQDLDSHGAGQNLFGLYKRLSWYCEY